MRFLLKFLFLLTPSELFFPGHAHVLLHLHRHCLCLCHWGTGASTCHEKLLRFCYVYCVEMFETSNHTRPIMSASLAIVLHAGEYVRFRELFVYLSRDKGLLILFVNAGQFLLLRLDFPNGQCQCPVEYTITRAPLKEWFSHALSAVAIGAKCRTPKIQLCIGQVPSSDFITVNDKTCKMLFNRPAYKAAQLPLPCTPSTMRDKCIYLYWATIFKDWPQKTGPVHTFDRRRSNF